MDDDKRSSPEIGPRRRPPTTIDLRATEIASDPVKAESTAQPEAPAAAKAAEPAQADAPKPEAPKEARKAGLGGPKARLAALRASLLEQMTARLAWAAGAGALVMLCLLAGLWGVGAFGEREDRVAALTARIAGLENQLKDVAGRPQPAMPDQRPLETRIAALDARLAKAEQGAGLAVLEARVAKAEQAVGRLGALEARVAKAEQAPPAVSATPANADTSARIVALESRLEAANAAAGDAKARADQALDAAQKNAVAPAAQAADHKEIKALVARVAALEKATKISVEQIARVTTNVGADRAGRFAFAATALRNAVERGDGFAAELAAARPLVPDVSVLTPLEPFATNGVPRAAALARELTQLAPKILAMGAQREASLMDKLQAGAERLVRVRPVGEAQGDDPAAIMARAEAKAAQGNLAGAVADLNRLPDTMRAIAREWIAKAEAQVAAIASARRIADGAVAALGK